MKTFKVLGSGCKSCIKTADLITQKAEEMGIDVKVEKVTEMSDILGYGVMSTPGVVMDEEVVHSGGIPGASQIEKWLAS